MENKKSKDSNDSKDFMIKDVDSGLENNINDLVSNQGSTGIKNINMVPKVSKIEMEYIRRAENFDRDEENPMYSDVDPTWGAPDNF